MNSRQTVVFAVSLLLISVAFADNNQPVLLQADRFSHIQFRKIPPNQYRFHDQQLSIQVNHSASFMMQAFDEVKTVRRVSFRWRSHGRPGVKNMQQEARRDGDDALFKLGLLLRSDEALFNPLLPAWMKKVRSLLHYPSANMINLVVGAKHPPGEQWPNPYNRRVTMISVPGIAGEDGWQQANYRFIEPRAVVAIWLMADGDNTGSVFGVDIRDIVLE
ncbi:MAG TPA: DUF3047 domain-containing protein [Gammaproteobacteria bacterium]|nr:DUF3047 domain-containing protein [Gammaproteobacteria bacterium]